MQEHGRPFDVQEELRIGGRASGLQIVLEAASGRDRAKAIKLAKRALSLVETQVAIEQGSPQCPEAWLTGMHDVERALRDALNSFTGNPPE